MNDSDIRNDQLADAKNRPDVDHPLGRVVEVSRLEVK